MNDIHRNEAELEGLVQTPPAYSHENHGKPFYRCLLEVPRLSGQVDLLPLLLPEELQSAAVPGERLRLQGQLRSYNNRGGQGSRLVLSTHALALSPPTGENRNRILLQGVLCKDPTYRRTPLGRSICDLMLAVSRRYGRADYLPLIAWGQLASDLSQRRTGDALALEGRIQSRLYTKRLETGPEQRTAYEVSVMHLIPGDPAWEEDGPFGSVSPT